MKFLSILHRWSGGFIGFLLAVLGLSGTLLVWKDSWIGVPGAHDRLVDNAAAAAKYEAALPAIRTAVQADPARIDNVNFLANALYADAAAQGALGRMDKVIALYTESAPYWRKLVEAKPTDAASRNIFAGILIQMGNQKLVGGDKTAADPLYEEALALARKSVAENGTDAVSRNILLSALIGASQTANDPALSAEALTMGKAMLSDGTIDAMNKPSIEAMTGTKAG